VIISFAVCLIFEETGKNIGIIDILWQYMGSDKIEPSANILSAQTGGFMTLVFACLTVSLFNIKSTHLSDLNIFKNTAFIVTAAGNILLLAIVMAVPLLRDILGFASLSAKSIVFALLIGIIIPSVYMLVLSRGEK
jgi:magnesium-transporting ATPase (P-type)